MKNKQILFTKPNIAEYIEKDIEEVKENEVMVKTAISTISCGTERANISGDPNCGIYSTSNVIWPRASGYSSSGIIVKKGINVTELNVGDRVAMAWSKHEMYNILDKSLVVKLPDEISFEEAAIVHICTFPLAAIRKTKLELGESVIVMGLGILGFLAVQFAKAAGAYPVIACDPNSKRCDEAVKYGADYTFNPLEDDFVEKVKETTNGGANTAIEVTGLGAGLEEVLECMAPLGRVALLGCTRDKNFTIDYYRKVHGPGISLIGAHTNARPKFDSSQGLFTREDDMKTAINLALGKRIDLKNIISKTYKPSECGEVYQRLVNDKDFPIVVQFDWTQEK